MANRYNDMGRVDKEVSALFFYCPNIFADKYFLLLILADKYFGACKIYYVYKFLICENRLCSLLF